VKGDTGPAGRSALQTLQSGETERGVVDGDFESPATSGDFGVSVTLPIPAPSAIAATSVDIDGTADETSNRCTGTVANPTAPAGVVCVYMSGSGNATSVTGFGAPITTTGSPYGFLVRWTVTATGDTFFYGNWAYTAP
jgi:hypothetical protein